MRISGVTLLSVLAAGNVTGQLALQASGTTASLRGIAAVSEGVAWASGTQGTVLQTTDGGNHWKHCSIPQGADTLDFRAVQAFDDRVALAMSAGPGALSKIFKTEDGCKTWRVVFSNPDAPGGFFDAMQFLPARETGGRERVGFLVGDPVRGTVPVFETRDSGENWKRVGGWGKALAAKVGESLFAASNSSLMVRPDGLMVRPDGLLFVTGGSASRCFRLWQKSKGHATELPLAHGPSAGAFSVAVPPHAARAGKGVLVAVGGDYQQPEQSAQVCARSVDGGQRWARCEAMPGGYRSAVAAAADGILWIAVGPNGTDVSRDEGRTWRPLKPGPGDMPDADKGWNALSLPFAVGSQGRIGRLKQSAH